MSSKKYRNKTCVYCGKIGASNTGDHVIAREFFPKNDRDNLPQVPACTACNNAKSTLEHYALSVLPFGARHEGAALAISEQVEPRLAKNLKLANSIAQSQQPYFVFDENNKWGCGVITSFDVKMLLKLTNFIAQGLAWHHWKIQLTPDSVVDARRLTNEGAKYIRAQMAGPAAGEQVKVILGKDIFQYHGAYQKTNRLKTIWEMTFFGGAEIGLFNGSGEITRSIFVVSGNKKDWSELVTEMNQRDSNYDKQ